MGRSCCGCLGSGVSDFLCVLCVICVCGVYVLSTLGSWWKAACLGIFWRLLLPLWVSRRQVTHFAFSKQTPFAYRLLCAPGWFSWQGPCFLLGLARSRVVKEAQSGGIWAVCSQHVDEVCWWLPSEPLSPDVILL